MVTAFSPGLPVSSNPAYTPENAPGFDGGGFLPNSLPNLQLWLDAFADGSITHDGGNPDKVSQWDDKSGNGNNAIQGTGSDQPTTNADTINSKNVIDFDGTDHFMNLDSDITLAADFSVFIVLNTDDTANTRMVIGDNVSGTKIGMINPNKLFVRVIDAGSSDTTQTFASGNPIMYLTRDTSNKVDQAFNGASLNRLFSNAAQSGTTTYGQVGRDGSGFHWDGDIAELIIYNRALSITERNSVEIYLSNKWGIGISAPDNIRGLQLWLDANDRSTITESGDKVSRWDDKSGNGNDVTQGTGANQPTTQSDAQNGKNVLVFDGTNHFMSSVFDASLDIRNDFTIIYVAKTDDTTMTRRILATDGYATGVASSARTQYTALGVQDYSSANDYWNTSSHIINTMTMDTSNDAIFYKNNAVFSSPTGANPANATTTGIFIGSRDTGVQKWDGEIAEIIIYDRVLSTAERTVLNRYLSLEWGLALS